MDHRTQPAGNLELHFFRLPSPLWPAALGLRMEVFVREQGVPEDMELDAFDPQALHLLASDGRGTAVGTLRIVTHGDGGKIGRVAVAASRRREGIGTRMMEAALVRCRALNLSHVALDSQQDAVHFYQRLGFVGEGPLFMDAGIPHVHMTLRFA